MAQIQGFSRMYVLVCGNAGCWNRNEKCDCQMLTVELHQNWQTAVTRCYSCSDWWRCWVEEPSNIIHYLINPPIALRIRSPTTSQDGGAIQLTVILNAFKDIYGHWGDAIVCEELEILTVHQGWHWRDDYYKKYRRSKFLWNCGNTVHTGISWQTVTVFI